MSQYIIVPNIFKYFLNISTKYHVSIEFFTIWFFHVVVPKVNANFLTMPHF